jgi:hypothetical protein
LRWLSAEAILSIAKPWRTSPSRPEHVRLALEELVPTLVKLGQTLSTRTDLLPPEYVAELAKLQDAASPVVANVARGVVVEGLEGEISACSPVRRGVLVSRRAFSSPAREDRRRLTPHATAADLLVAYHDRTRARRPPGSITTDAPARSAIRCGSPRLVHAGTASR